MTVLGIDNVFVEVGDLDEAVQFYREKVGLPVQQRFDDLGMALFGIGDETPGLCVRAVAAPRAGGQKVWLEVADALAVYEALQARGVEPVAPPFRIPTGRAFEICDPWGNVLGFTDYASRPELGRQRL